MIWSQLETTCMDEGISYYARYQLVGRFGVAGRRGEWRVIFSNDGVSVDERIFARQADAMAAADERESEEERKRAAGVLEDSMRQMVAETRRILA